MKNLISLTFLMLTSILAIQAQVDVKQPNSTDLFKPQDGDKSIEVNFNPRLLFGSKGDDQNSLFNTTYKFRYFNKKLSEPIDNLFQFIKADLSALRLNVNLKFGSNTDITQQKDDNSSELKDRNSFFAINVQPGYEKHFSANKRLSPYVGTQVSIGYVSSSMKSDFEFNGKVFNKKWTNNVISEYQGMFSFGIGAFAGIDYYFIKKLYIGIEVGYDLRYDKKLNSKFTNERDSNSDYNKKNGYDFNLLPSLATGNLRLGWTF